MLNAKRLYLYGVLGVALAILLWGATSIFRLALRAMGAAAGSRDAVGADVVLIGTVEGEKPFLETYGI